MTTKPSVAFVGAGPTTIYTLAALVDGATSPFSLTIFEEQPQVGRGTPYRPGWNDPAMLSNIASIEIPPIAETLFEWLRRQPSDRLAALGVAEDEIGERVFYPRVTLGEFFHDQLQALIARAQARGIAVDVRTSCRVLDAVSAADGMTLTVRPRRGSPFEARFDHVVLATGHQWPHEPEVRPGYFLSPWPASALQAIPPARIGIRGSSLTAIDAVVALAVAHGAFAEEGARLAYAPEPGTDGFHVTMLSRKGLLPEADFYFPIPYEPLSICTAEAIERIVEAGEKGEDGNFLDQAYALFKAELAAADPAYAAQVELETLDLEDFCDRYFAPRLAADPWQWARDNLAEAERDYASERTIPWRYAVLRMHEVIEQLVPHLDTADFQRFSRYFKPVFVDDYATVPHESIKRLLALHEAGKLSVMGLGEHYRVDSHGPESGAIVHVDGQRLHFPVFIEATGQRALSSGDFPFPSLCRQGIVRDAAEPEDKAPSRGILVDDAFHPVSDAIPDDQLFCLSLPFLMGRHPFIQGITSSHEMGKVVGERLAAVIALQGSEVEN